MRLDAVLVARFLGFVELAQLNPGGRVFFPNVIGAMVERFNFQKYPTKLEDFDESKGIEFAEGRWNGTNVPRLTIYNNGFLVDTQTSTNDSERVLFESLEWAKQKFGITFTPGMIFRKRYLSDLLFYCEAPILNWFMPVENLNLNLANVASHVLGEQLAYSSIRVDLDFERYQRNAPIAPFTIQRRLEFAFSDNMYFSEAPLPTEDHKRLLEQFEKDVLAVRGPEYPQYKSVQR
ncbi:MAG: hypothetical protein CXZ00_02190 [Acidobacteria bacterium]|nr:MAG: hypothetical protein CXZ00_02190 [Acidobacteriota bacterium]